MLAGIHGDLLGICFFLLMAYLITAAVHHLVFFFHCFDDAATAAEETTFLLLTNPFSCCSTAKSVAVLNDEMLSNFSLKRDSTSSPLSSVEPVVVATWHCCFSATPPSSSAVRTLELAPGVIAIAAAAESTAVAFFVIVDIFAFFSAAASVFEKKSHWQNSLPVVVCKVETRGLLAECDVP